MKKHRLAAALATVLVCAGCESAPAVTAAPVTEPTAAAAAATEAPEDIPDADEDDDEITAEAEDETEYTETAENNGADAYIAALQMYGQVIYMDDCCAIRYFGETRADNGELIIVLGYSKFHGGLVRILENGFHTGSRVDGSSLWFSDMNGFTDGYWCHSGVHGWEFYDDPADVWWKDNDYIFLRCPTWNTQQDIGSDRSLEEYAEITEGEYIQYDDSVYDGVSVLSLYVYGLKIQESIHMTGTETEPPYFEEPTSENTHTCLSDDSATVIRVRFDPEKDAIWVHT